MTRMLEDTLVNEDTISTNFSAKDADITIRSSDGVLFQLHRKNLETHCAEFSSVEWIPSPSSSFNKVDILDGDEGDIIQLPENARVLDLLFHHIYPRPQPNLDDVEFEVFADYAEAVERYEVYSAMDMCLHRMKRAVQSHPLLVIKYAMKHRKYRLADAAAPYTLCMRSKYIVQHLPAELAIIWFLYRENWQETITRIIQNLPESHYSASNPDLLDEPPIVCPYWAKWRDVVSRELREVLPGSDRELRAVFNRHEDLLDPSRHHECECASHLPNDWEEEAANVWKSAQRTFSSFSTA